MWTDELTQLLYKLWKDGLSAGRIAAELSTPTKSFTRNAILGKIHRMGWSGREGRKFHPPPSGPRQRNRPRVAKPQVKERRSTFTASFQSPYYFEPVIINKPTGNTLPDIVRPVLWRFPYGSRRRQPRYVTILELARDLDGKPDNCRFVIGDPQPFSADTLYCGVKTNKRIESGAYCNFHARIVYQNIASVPAHRKLTAITPVPPGAMSDARPHTGLASKGAACVCSSPQHKETVNGSARKACGSRAQIEKEGRGAEATSLDA